VASVDRLPVEWDACEAPAAAITSAADAGVPVVVCDPDGRPRRATRATRAGATEYLAPSALDGETVADCVVRAAVDDPGTDGPAFGTDAPPVAGRSDFARLFDGLPDAVIDAEFVDREPVVRSVNAPSRNCSATTPPRFGASRSTNCWFPRNTPMRRSESTDRPGATDTV